jgi:hypothetical protein
MWQPQRRAYYRGVVLLVADDEETIRATHAHYFSRLMGSSTSRPLRKGGGVAVIAR